jgi:hypothetical protein
MTVPGSLYTPLIRKIRSSGHVVDGSGLFDGSSGQLARTPSSAGNQDTFTVEFIFKLSLGVTNPILLGVNPTSSQDDTNSFTIQLIGSGTTGYNVRVVGWGTTWLETTQELSDPAAYQSLIVACDSINSTAANRVRMYLNGTEVTDFATRNNPTRYQNFGMNGTVPHEIGSYAGGSAFINDYVSRVVSIDGYALSPTDFGEVTTDGFWQINEVKENFLSIGADVTGAATDSSVSASAASTYTFSNQAIGTATSDRVVIVNFGSLKDTSATYSVTSVTIGGVAATRIHSTQTQTSWGLSSYYATVPTGTTADIVIVHSANMNRCGIQVVTTTNIGELHQVALAEASSGSDPLSFTVDAPAGSLVVGYVYDTGSSSQTWTELTENFDEQISATHYHSGAIKNYSSAATPTITADPSGSSTTFGIVVVFRPESSGWNFGTNGFLIEGGDDVAAGTDSSTPDAGYAQNDSIPTMTGTSAPSGTAIFDSESSPTYSAWKAFDKNTSTRWARNTAGQAGWIGYDFGTGKVIKKVILQAPSNSEAEMPKNYTIDGYNGSAWVTITTITNGAAFSADEQRVHTFTNTTSYNKYRVNITASEDGANCTMGELAMFEGGDGVNHFTKTGTITATDDSPTDDADNNYGDYCTFSPLAINPSTTQAFSNGNLTCGITQSDQNVQGTIFFDPEDTDGYYFEVTLDTDAGNAGIGLARMFRQANANGAPNLFMYQDNGYAYPFGGGSDSSVNSYTSGDVIGFFVRGGKIWFHKNGTYEASGNPNADSNPFESGITGSITVALAQGQSTGTAVYTLNTGQSSYAHTPPTNAKKIATHNLPEPAVANYEDEYYIEAGISHTNGATTAVTLPTSVSGGAMAMIKRTDSTGGWYVVDTVRGANKFVYWDSDAAEDTSTFTDQNLTGTTLTLPGALATGTYMIEVFYVGSHFQIHAYTGTGSAHAESYSATLDTAPGMMYIKNRDTASRNGIIYHTSVGATKYLRANATTVATTSSSRFNDTEPTTTAFTVGTENVVNASGEAIISYHWANSGPYAFGSYIGNNSASGPMINISGYPQNTLTKHTTSAEGWWSVPVVEQTNSYNTVTYRFRHDTTAVATTSASMFWDYLSNGFKLRSTNPAYNTSGAVYIYGAFGIRPIQGNGTDTSQGRAK